MKLTLDERHTRARHANAPLPASTTILQPLAGDLGYLIPELQAEATSYKDLAAQARFGCFFPLRLVLTTRPLAEPALLKNQLLDMPRFDFVLGLVPLA